MAKGLARNAPTPVSGQAGKSPASHGVAMAVRVLVPFESFEDIVGIRIPGLGCGLGKRGGIARPSGTGT